MNRTVCEEVPNGSGSGRVTDHETEEAADGDLIAQALRCFCEELCDGLFVVLEVLLIEEADLFVEGVEFTLHDVLDDVRGFALNVFAFALDLAFALEHVCGDIAAADVQGVHCGDLQGEGTDQVLEGGIVQGVGLVRADFDQDAKFGSLMDVSGDLAGALYGDALMATDGDVFTGLRDGLLPEGFEIGIGICENGLGESITETAEILVPRDEIGFAVHFDQRSGVVVAGQRECDDAFTGFAIGLLCGIGCALFPEDIDSGFEVALGFEEGGFAFHHPRVGFVAQGFDGFWIDLNFAHGLVLGLRGWIYWG